MNGKRFDGWRGLSITRSVEAICAYYTFEFSDMWTADQVEWPLNAQDDVEVILDGNTVITGYIDVVSGELTDSARTYTVQGRDKTSDLIECSAPSPPKAYNSITFLNFCKALTKGMNINFTLGPGDYKKTPIETLAYHDGDKIFDILDEYASQCSALLVPDGKGGLVITSRESGKSVDKIIEGLNAKSFSYQRDYTDRFSDYRVQGKTSGKGKGKGKGWFNAKTGSTSSRSLSTAKDLGVTRYRPLVISLEGNKTSEITENRAELEAVIRASKSLVVNCKVAGWTQSNGKVWTINETVQLVAPRLGIGNSYGDEYLISETIFTLSDNGGSETELTLVPKDAFLRQKQIRKKKQDQKSKGWFSSHNDDIRVFPGESKPERGLAH